MEAAERQCYTVEEYIQLEPQSDCKHEYMDGEIIAMVGGEPSHSLIAGNIGVELRTALRNSSCRAYNSDLQVAISWSQYTYPNVSVVCGPVQHLSVNNMAVSNPTMLVEVLSDSTAAHDRGEKFRLYRQIPAFQEYVLISQNQPLVEVYYKLEDTVWRMSTYEGLDKIARFDSIGVSVALSEIYLNIDLPPKPEEVDIPQPV